MSPDVVHRSLHRYATPGTTSSGLRRGTRFSGKIPATSRLAASGAIVFTQMLNFCVSNFREFIKPMIPILAAL
jgi:hypothetical protein